MLRTPKILFPSEWVFKKTDDAYFFWKKVRFFLNEFFSDLAVRSSNYLVLTVTKQQFSADGIPPQPVKDLLLLLLYKKRKMCLMLQFTAKHTTISSISQVFEYFSCEMALFINGQEYLLNRTQSLGQGWTLDFCWPQSVDGTFTWRWDSHWWKVWALKSFWHEFERDIHFYRNSQIWCFRTLKIKQNAILRSKLRCTLKAMEIGTGLYCNF